MEPSRGTRIRQDPSLTLTTFQDYFHRDTHPAVDTAGDSIGSSQWSRERATCSRPWLRRHARLSVAVSFQKCVQSTLCLLPPPLRSSRSTQTMHGAQRSSSSVSVSGRRDMLFSWALGRLQPPLLTALRSSRLDDAPTLLKNPRTDNAKERGDEHGFDAGPSGNATSAALQRPEN